MKTKLQDLMISRANFSKSVPSNFTKSSLFSSNPLWILVPFLTTGSLHIFFHFLIKVINLLLEIIVRFLLPQFLVNSLEHIVHSNIMDFLDQLNYLSPFQHGFRQKRSCESQLLTTLRDFSSCLNSNGQKDAVLLDFSKAFDKVDH